MDESVIIYNFRNELNTLNSVIESKGFSTNYTSVQKESFFRRRDELKAFLERRDQREKSRERIK